MSTETETLTFDLVYRHVVDVLTAIVGPEHIERTGVSPATRFEADLELESMEIVQLAEELMEGYGSQVDFVGWFAAMDLDELLELTVGQLVEFVVRSGGDPADEPGGG
jgi:acyl carrier protein